MRHRRVFIDASFGDVLLDVSDERHAAAVRVFETLLIEFEGGTTLLYSHGAVVAEVGERRGAKLFAVCHVVALRRWLTREAQRVRRRHPAIGGGRAMTLVLMRRWRIGEIASFDPFLAGHGIPTIPMVTGPARTVDESSQWSKQLPTVTAGGTPTAKLLP